MKLSVVLASLTALAIAPPLLAQSTPDKIALGDAGVTDGWIYEDIDKGYELAKKSGKPLLVAFR